MSNNYKEKGIVDNRKLYVTKSDFLIDVNMLDTVQDFINFFFRQEIFWFQDYLGCQPFVA